MIKVETLGMLDVAKINPVLKADEAVENYSFLTDNGILYLICNTLVGDNAYKDKYTFPAGEYLNGYVVKAWEGQKLVIDEEHIAYGSGETYASLVPGETVLIVNEAGKLAVSETTPADGVYLLVTDKTTLTGKAVKACVVVVDANATA